MFVLASNYIHRLPWKAISYIVQFLNMLNLPQLSLNCSTNFDLQWFSERNRDLAQRNIY